MSGSGATALADGGRALARAARGGDEGAFTTIVDHYTGPLFGYLRMLQLTEADAEDLVQDTFIRAYRALDRYDDRYACSTWLFTIARRLTLNHHRDRRGTAPLVAAESTGDASAATEAPSDQRDEITWLWRFARHHLSDRHFEVLWLHYGEDLDHRQIAGVLAISAVNARVLLHRARKRLRQLVASHHPDQIEESDHDALVHQA